MKKTRFLQKLLTFAAILLLTACGHRPPVVTPSDVTSEESESILSEETIESVESFESESSAESQDSTESEDPIESEESVEESIESEDPSESEEPIESEEPSEESSEKPVESEEPSESEDPSESESEPDDPVIPSGYGLENDPINTDPVAKEYYKGISATLEGESLKTALYNLIHPKKCTTGYGAVWNYLVNCDADPDNPSSGKVVAYYRGTTGSKGSMNREHVWPNSRGGGSVEGDPHMTRPTFNSDNSSRGNSFYVEGMNHSQDGWDPYADGMSEYYRGDAARIIMYCAVQEKGSLKLVDKTNDSTGNRSMGKLSDLIKWNYEYPINKFEKFRNEVLSGQRSVNGQTYHFNRNPFIDDRNLACRIWGDTNEETRRLCAIYSKTTAPTRIELNYDEYTLSQGGTVQLKVSDFAPADAVTSVTWTSSNTSVATVNEGLVKALSDGVTIITATSTVDQKVKATCEILVHTEPVDLMGVSASHKSITIEQTKSSQISATVSPTNAYPLPGISFKSEDTTIATVDSNGKVTGVNVGETTIIVTATQGTITKTDTVEVTVLEKSKDGNVEVSSFESTSGKLDDYISFTTEKGGGTADPYASGGVIRLYQNSSGTGGGILRVKSNGAKIKSITVGSSMSTSIKYTVNGVSSTNIPLSANGKLTVDDLLTNEVSFQCMGTSQSARFYLNYLQVTYSID